MTDQERAQTRQTLRYAVAFALQGRLFVLRVWLYIVAGAAALETFWTAWWPVPVALGLSVAVHLRVTQFRVMYVTQRLGVPPDVQDIAIRLYKTDARFRREADHTRRGFAG